MIVTFDHVSAAYAGDLVLEDVSLEIPRGSFVGIVGPSGAGKTTLLRLVSGQLQPVSGSVAASGRIGYVPQLETIDWTFPVTVEEVVCMGMTTKRPWTSRADRAASQGILTRLGVGELAGRHIRALSGGQQQRVFLARALAAEPDILLLDEPTSGVDIRTRHDVLHLLHDLNHRGITILLTTHDLNAVAAHLPNLLCVNRRIVAGGTAADVLTADVLEATYGERMEVFRSEDRLIVVDQPATTINGAGVGHAQKLRVHHH